MFKKIFSLIIFLIAVTFAFIELKITLACGAISLLYMLLKDKQGLKTVPWLGLLVWVGAFGLAKIITLLLKGVDLSAAISTTDLSLLTVGIVGATNLITNTAITVLGLPIFLDVFANIDPGEVTFWFLTVSGLSFVFPVANGCLAATVGMGVSLKRMAKIGTVIVLIHLVIFLIYFNIRMIV